VNIESAVYGVLMGSALVFVMWRMGIGMTPWPEALLGVLVVGSFIVTIWRRFAHRPA
jgi:hypothetical protein